MTSTRTMPEVILTCFAGRRSFMALQLQYMLRILDKYDYVTHYDIWNFAWSAEDSAWLDSLQGMHPKIRVRHAPGIDQQAVRAGEVASRQFAHFYARAYEPEAHRDTLFIKVDDDVVYVDVDRFGDFIKTRMAHPEAVLFSANVVNSDLREKRAAPLHDAFLRRAAQGRIKEPMAVEPFSAKNRLSVNFVCWQGRDLPHIAEEFSNGVGSEDEWRLCHVVPTRLGRDSMVLQNYMVAHLAFGMQIKPRGLLRRPRLNAARYIRRYQALSDSEIAPTP